MKKFTTFMLLIAVTLTLTGYNESAYAKEIPESNETIYISDDLYIECMITEKSPLSTYSTSKSKTVSKIYTLKTSSDKSLVSFKLTGTFTYNGSTSSCTSATYSTTIYDDTWKFTSKSASKSGNTATGKFTAKKYLLIIPIQTVTKTITLTCDKNGNIS